MRVGELCAEDGRVEAGAILAGLVAVVDDHVRGEDVAAGRGDLARAIPPQLLARLTSAYEIHLPLPYPVAPKIRRSPFSFFLLFIYLFSSAPTPPRAWSFPCPFHLAMLALLFACCGRRPPPVSPTLPTAPPPLTAPPQTGERAPLIPPSDDTHVPLLLLPAPLSPPAAHSPA